MKNLPDKLYLQIGEEADDSDDFNSLYGVSWCDDQIHKNDVVYVREDIMIKRLASCWKTIMMTNRPSQA
jgi:hypothetical protein